jgi:hypothetical protein
MPGMLMSVIRMEIFSLLAKVSNASAPLAEARIDHKAVTEQGGRKRILGDDTAVITEEEAAAP